MKYQRVTLSDGKNIGIRKSEFVTKTQFLFSRSTIAISLGSESSACKWLNPQTLLSRWNMGDTRDGEKLPINGKYEGHEIQPRILDLTLK